MQRLSVVLSTGVLLLLFQLSALAQGLTDSFSTINPYHLAVSYNKTSNLIFPYAIKSVDRGSAAVITQKAKGADNILQVKAGRRGFTQTNLTVITTDDQFYSFLLDYALEPSILNISFVSEIQKQALSRIKTNESLLNDAAENVKNAKQFLNIHTQNLGMRLTLNSIYLDNKTMWFTLAATNQSLINFKPEYVRFFLRDRKRGKRTAVQEMEIQPLFSSVIENIQGLQSQKLIFGFTPFTIPSSKRLIIQLGEENGGRSLVLAVRSRKILNARLLNYCEYR